MDGAPSAICRMVTMLVLAPARWSRCCPGDARNAEATGGRMEMVIKWWGQIGWFMIRRYNYKSTNDRFVNYWWIVEFFNLIGEPIQSGSWEIFAKPLGKMWIIVGLRNLLLTRIWLVLLVEHATDAAARVNPQTLQQSFHCFLNPSHSCGFHHWRAMRFKKWPFQVMTDPLILFDLYMSKGPLFGSHFEGALKNTLPPSQCCHQISLWDESSGEMPWCSGMGPARREETNMAWKIRWKIKIHVQGIVGG